MLLFLPIFLLSKSENQFLILSSTIILETFLHGSIIIWAGWRASRKFGQGFLGGITCAVFSVVIPLLVYYPVVTAVTLLPVVFLQKGSTASSHVDLLIIAAGLLFGFAFGMFFNVLQGAFFGAIGSLVASIQRRLEEDWLCSQKESAFTSRRMPGRQRRLLGGTGGGLAQIFRSELALTWAIARSAVIGFIGVSVLAAALVAMATLLPVVGQSLAGLFGLLHLIAGFLLLAWSGLLAARHRGGWDAGAKAGACAGFMGGLVLGVIGLALLVVSGLLNGINGLLIGIIEGLIVLIMAPLFWAIIGVIAGAMGGFAAESENSKHRSAPTRRQKR